jgi:hypothetical protein
LAAYSWFSVCSHKYRRLIKKALVHIWVDGQFGLLSFFDAAALWQSREKTEEEEE